MSQIEENINRFMVAQQRAKQLIQMDCNGTLDKIKNKVANEGKISLDTNTKTQNTSTNQIQEDYNALPNFYKAKSKLPIEILESFQGNPIDVNESVLSKNSVLDKIMPNLVTEEKIEKTSQEPLLNTSNNIDYGLIKTIVESCLKKMLSANKKSILNENVNNQIQALKFGNKFTFITNNGDLYEAKLKFIKNIKEKDGN